MDNTNILLVDDDQKTINALKRILNKNNYIIYSATDANKGIEIIKNYQIDIIICDYHMPDLTGIEVLKQSKEILPDAIRILITGTRNLDMTIAAINEAGIYYYITKPWINKDITDIINQAIKEKKDNSIKQLPSDSAQTIKVPSVFPVTKGEDIILIKDTEICYLYAEKGNTLIVTDKDKFKNTYSLNTWESKLNKTDFFRCHRGYIVNINKIDKISPWFNNAYNIKLKNSKDIIPVSRGNMAKLKNIFK